MKSVLESEEIEECTEERREEGSDDWIARGSATIFEGGEEVEDVDGMTERGGASVVMVDVLSAPVGEYSRPTVRGHPGEPCGAVVPELLHDEIFISSRVPCLLTGVPRAGHSRDFACGGLALSSPVLPPAIEKWPAWKRCLQGRSKTALILAIVEARTLDVTRKIVESSSPAAGRGWMSLPQISL